MKAEEKKFLHFLWWTDKNFIIPVYQRNYDWKREQCKQLFDDLLETLEIGSLCALGGGIPLPLKNALQYFQEELKGYFTNN